MAKTEVATGMMDQDQEAMNIIEQVVKVLGRQGHGYDTEGRDYQSFLSMWKQEGMIKTKPGHKTTSKRTTKPASSTTISPQPEAQEGSAASSSSASSSDQPSKPLKWYTEAYAYWEVRMWTLALHIGGGLR